MSEIPQWAINEALKRCGVDPTEIPFVNWRDRTYAKAVELFAAHIAEHEEPPVDPLEEERQIIADEFRLNLSAMPAVEKALLAALRRGIEIGKGGCQDG